MSDTFSVTSPVCPGSANLLPGYGRRYLRVMFTAYWDGASPSAEDIYFTKHRIWMTYKGLQDLQQYVLRLIQDNVTDNMCVDVKFDSYVGVELDEDDVAALDWRVVEGCDL